MRAGADSPPLAVTDADSDGERICLRCEDGVVVELGPEVRPAPGDEVIDAAGAPLTAALVNGHTHAAMTLFRASGGDLPLMRWLRERVWPFEGRLDEEDVYWGTRLACLEMIRSGTVRFWDMYWHPAASGRAVVDSGLRAVIGAPLFDVDGDAERMRGSALESLDRLAELGPAVQPALAPHSIYTVSRGSLEWIAALAAERDLPIHIHLSETEQEVADCLDSHSVRPTAYLDDLGALGPKTLLAHCVWLDRGELELAAARGATLVSNPVANMKLGVGGVFPYPAARDAGAAIGLGTDGAGSNDSLDLIADVKTFALIQKHAAADAAAVCAAEAWELASGLRAPLLGTSPPAVGAPADFLLLRRDSPALGFGERADSLVYAADASVVDTVVAAGKVLMRGGEVPGAEEVIAQAAERARRLGIGKRV